MYISASVDGAAASSSPGVRIAATNRWVQYFTSSENRHALPLFTSLLNTVCGYMPAGILPYNHLIFNDTREELVEVALQVNLNKFQMSQSSDCSELHFVYRF
jgi:hypothetical protein